MSKDIIVVKANGEKELFNANKLKYSLIKAGATEEVVEKIAAHVALELVNGMSTTEIYTHAFYLLSKEHKPVALRYSLRRSLMDLGPSGFPFEKFIGELYRRKGYTVLTDQIVQGECVEHEVDVVAFNDDKLIMCEVKFHNQHGIKSDLKVALYVKARFDDLRQTTFKYEGIERKLTDGILITNTKFTTSAIKYAECQNLQVIGWNYPAKESLVSMIEESGLHPLTCLTTLKNSEKIALMNKGVVLCNSLREDPHRLKEIGISDTVISQVLEESKLLCPID